MRDDQPLLSLYRRLSSHINSFLKRPSGSQPPADFASTHRSIDIDIRARLATSEEAWADTDTLAGRYVESLRRDAAKMRGSVSEVLGENEHLQPPVET
jgi:hypothetical protein